MISRSRRTRLGSRLRGIEGVEVVIVGECGVVEVVDEAVEGEVHEGGEEAEVSKSSFVNYVLRAIWLVEILLERGRSRADAAE